MTISIGFHPPLPCCTMQDADGTLCGKQATVGTLYPAAGGLWMLQPFCRDCAIALVSVYSPPDELFPPAAGTSAITPADAERITERIAERAIRVVGLFKRFGGEP